QKISTLYGKNYNIEDEITVTAGATQAIMTAILAIVHPNDEVIVLEPCYDSYVPSIELAGGRVVRVALTPKTFRPDFDAISKAITPKTIAIIINTPHNPSATIWSEADMLKLQKLLEPTNIILISDEVYEHMVYDEKLHQSAARFSSLSERAFIISSFGKTYHVTGWKVGYVVAPKELMIEFRKVHQFNVFSVNTPMQFALANYMTNNQSHNELSYFYQNKRDRFKKGLENSGLKLLSSEGTYFQCADISGVSALSDIDFCRWLISEIGVAAIPMSVFYGSGFDEHIVRFCFAKKDETLDAAINKLLTI
ncbi:MAG: hypothetical protein RL154_599, partial [Pseudomonadota bacterium]